MQPIILLTQKYTEKDPWGNGGIRFVRGNYITAVGASGFTSIVNGGGDPKIFADIADCVLFTGGGDLNPALYGEEVNGSVRVEDDIDEIELALFDAFYKAGKPIFGICRGIQLINVAMGGSLVQDIPTQVTLGAHKPVYAKETRYHSVHAEGFVKDLFGEDITVNSYHHQSVKALGSGLRAVAYTDEGVIEAIQHESKPIYAVQWHPERMLADEDHEGPDMKPYFDFMLRAVAGR